VSFAMGAKQAALPTKTDAARPIATSRRSSDFLGNQAALGRLSPAPLGLQPKLEIGAVDDPLEREADEVADKVMRMADPAPSVRSTPPKVSRKCAACEEEDKKVQRKCAACEEEDKKAQRKPDAAPQAWGEAPASVRDSLASSGQPLGADPRAYFEPRFGRPFGDVRVHVGAAASRSAKDIGALAYTVGSDIVFAGGAFAPGTDGGRRLIAHELAHVAQQTGAAPSAPTLARKDDPNEAKVDFAGGAESFDLSVAVAGEEEKEAKPQTRMVRRQSAPADASAAKVEPTRPEEIAASKTSDGQVASEASPPLISLYNFAIDSAELKPFHKQLIMEFGALIKSSGGSAWLTVNAAGNADSSGPPEINTPLSKRRAESVQAALAAASGVTATLVWHGEDVPVVPNDTADGRSRNRRVDIAFTVSPAQGGTVPAPQNQKPKQDTPGGGNSPRQADPDPKKRDPDPNNHDPDPNKRDPDPGKKGPGPGGGGGTGDPPPDYDWFCSRHPILCLAFGAAAAFAIACALKLIPCVPILPVIPPILPPPLPPTKDPPPTEDPKKKSGGDKRAKACLVDSDLPAGNYEVAPELAHQLFKVRFEMKLKFEETDPAAATAGDGICRAYCGEYRQKIQGYFRIERADGSITNREKPLSKTTNLDEKSFQEDGDIDKGPYGHRFVDASRRTERANSPEDSFTPKRGDGPNYKGLDTPGIEQEPPPFDTNLNPGDTYVMNLEFMGAPVDTCSAEAAEGGAIPTRPDPVPIGGWNTWTAKGRYTKPGGGSVPPPSSGKPPPSLTLPRPYAGNATAAPPTNLFYAGGLGANPHLGPAIVRVKFTTKSGQHFSMIPVNVTEAALDPVTFVLASPVKINVAPEGEPPIVFIPGREMKVPRRVIAASP